jgi:UDP-galactopyranose mutase
MDELSAFKNAPLLLTQLEEELFNSADIVFTGGYSLYKAKKDKHHNVHLFPSSIDRKHFEKAREIIADPSDQENIPYPRIGYCGVIDERMNIDLLEAVAREKPEWHFIMIGPVIKIDPATLPGYSNIHYLGAKTYDQLPGYLSGWDVAMMPFAMNESTRFISPTKTPEYLAAGKPVVSTPVHDVVKIYGEQGLVYIAGNSNDFIEKIQLALQMPNADQWLKAVDTFLAKSSWDNTAEKMMYHINTALETKKDPLIQRRNYV